jgi:predicted dehydrogenase
MLKIGVVGGGHIVKHRHIPVFKKIRDVEVCAVCDKQESIARSVTERFGIKRYYTGLSEMLKEENLNIVDICTPPQTHVSLAIDAMEAGCHVLVEKPLAMIVKDVDEMFKVSKREHVKLCVVHQNLFNPAFQKARRLVEGGAVGDLISVDVGTFVRRDNFMCVNGKHWCHRLSGGIFFELLPHPVYLLQVFLKNSKPAHVLTRKLSDFSWMKADEARVLMDADNGVGSVIASCNSPFHGDTINIFGSKMSLQVDLWGRSVIKYMPRTEDPYSVGKGNLSLAFQFLTLIGTTVSNSFTMASGGVKVSAHYGFLREFVRSIQSGGKLPVSEEEARENVGIVESICEAIDDSVSKLR